MEYVDFDVEIGAAKDGTYEARVSALGAITRGVVTLPFDPSGGDALKRRLLALQVALLRSAGDTFRAATPESAEVESFGGELWTALFTNDIRARYEATRAAAGPGRGVRVRMSFTAPELAALPWEYTFDPTSRTYVALAPKTPLVRFIEMDAITEPLTVELPLRILAMAVNPKDMAPLAIDRERQLLTAALRPLEDRGLVSVTWLEERTREALGDALQGDNFHVFHFIGHGGYDEVKGEGLIVIEDANGNARRLPAKSIGLLLGGRNQMRLAILNSCESAKGDLVDVFSSVAATVVRSGTPAVIAMQFAITDEAAVEFSRSLYKAIGIGLPVDASLTEARISVATEFSDTLEWGTPVLYMRARDGVLFRMPVIPKVEHDEIDSAVEAAREADRLAREEEARRAELLRRDPVLTVSPVEARPGAVMSISGSGFERDTTIELSVGGLFLESATTDGGGGFATSVTVPGNVRGPSAMVATEPSGRTASFNVKIAPRPPWRRILASGGVAAILVVVLLLVALPGGPSLVVSAAEAHAGDIVSLSGSGFQPNSNVQLTLGGVVLGSVVTDRDGAFVTSVTVPDAVAGSSAMVATEPSGRAVQHAFEVLEPDPTNAQTVAVPSIVGATAEVAASLLRDACQPAPCLLIEVQEEAHPDAPPGTVHRQSPEAGSSVGQGEKVTAFVAPIPPTPTPTASASPTPTPTVTPTPTPTPTPTLATVAEWALAKAREIENQGHPVGQPVGTTQPTDDGRGQYQRFTGALVYLTPAGNVVLLRGGLLADWQNRGGGSAAVADLGYPLAEEEIDGGGHPFQRFDNGVLQCAPSGGCARAIVQPVYSYWLEYQGFLGYPVDDTRSYGGGNAIGGEFQGGVAYIEDGGFVAVCTWDGQVLESNEPISDCQGVITIIKGG